jgi:hypothetical protein
MPPQLSGSTSRLVRSSARRVPAYERAFDAERGAAVLIGHRDIGIGSLRQLGCSEIDEREDKDLFSVPAAGMS